MTNLYDGQLTDLIQNAARYNPEIIALSYAILTEKRRLLALTDQTRTLSMIDQLPEGILDVLAVELRTPYYTQDMTVEEKRDIIKSTLRWYKKAGTVAAVVELIESVFGTGSVVEWFDFTEGEAKPGTFDIVSSAQLTEDILDSLTRIIGRVKNTRSHIRKIDIQRRIGGTTYAAAALESTGKFQILNHLDADMQVSGMARFAASGISAPKIPVTNTAEIQTQVQAPSMAAAGICSFATAVVPL